MHKETATVCLACASNDLIPVISLPDTPLTDKYLDSVDGSLALQRYPLIAYFCQICSHLQLGLQVDPSESYIDYIYHSDVTVGLNKTFNNYARDLRLSLTSPSPTLLDIGSNDGSFLYACRVNGIDAYGIEPAKMLSNKANNLELRTLNAFFDASIDKKLKDYGLPSDYDVITFNNVFANLCDPIDSLLIAKSLLREETSRIIIQTGYHPIQFSKGLFDYIYHEHFSYFTIKSMNALSLRAGLSLSSFQIMPLRGGSIRFELSLQESDNEPMHNIERYSFIDDFYSLNTQIYSSISHLRNLLCHYKAQGMTICGFGASHSTGTLMYAFGLECYIDFLVDDNKLKHGKYMPGTRLIVNSLESIKLDSSVVVILAWQYYHVIYSRLRSFGFKGPILKPVLP